MMCSSRIIIPRNRHRERHNSEQMSWGRMWSRMTPRDTTKSNIAARHSQKYELNAHDQWRIQTTQSNRRGSCWNLNCPDWKTDLPRASVAFDTGKGRQSWRFRVWNQMTSKSLKLDQDWDTSLMSSNRNWRQEAWLAPSTCVCSVGYRTEETSMTDVITDTKWSLISRKALEDSNFDLSRMYMLHQIKSHGKVRSLR